jgi:hypothetical protein
MEPERPIEKLLRGYAKQRRESAGTPPSLHQVARRELLAEAARVHNPRRTGARWWLLLRSSWPRMAVGVGALGVLIVAAAVWTSSNYPKFRSSEFQMAKSEGIRSTGTATPLEKAAADRALAPTAKESFAERSAGSTATLASAATNEPVFEASPAAAVSAPAPVVKSIAKSDTSAVALRDQPTLRVTTAAPAAKREVAEAETKTFDKAKTEALSVSAPPVQAPVATDSMQAGTLLQAGRAGADQGRFGFGANTGASQQAASFFSNNNSNTLAALFTNQAPPPAKAPPTQVMAQFRVEQEGDVVRIIDNDGSVYTGSIEVTAASPPAAGVSATRLSVQRARAVETPQSVNPQAQNFYLQASGTNRTLNQKVVFTGNVFGNDLPAVANFQNQQPSLQNQRRQQQMLNLMRITGNARVGKGTDLRVEAVPVQ